MILFYFLSSILIVSFPTEAEYIGHDCPTLAVHSTSTFKSNLNQLLSTLSSNANRNDTTGFNKATVGTTYGFNKATVGTTYGLFLCRGDSSASVCNECMANATSEALLRCPDNQQTVVWYDHCMLRYSNQPFHSEAATSPSMIGWSPRNLPQYVEEPEFNDVVGTTLDNLVRKGANARDKFATKEVTFTGLISFTVYSLGQCTPDLSAADCNACLRKALTQLVPNKQGGRVLYPSCNVRFEMYPFYQEVTITTKQPLVPEPPPPALTPSLPPPPSAPPSTRQN